MRKPRLRNGRIIWTVCELYVNKAVILHHSIHLFIHLSTHTWNGISTWNGRIATQDLQITFQYYSYPLKISISILFFKVEHDSYWYIVPWKTGTLGNLATKHLSEDKAENSPTARSTQKQEPHAQKAMGINDAEGKNNQSSSPSFTRFVRNTPRCPHDLPKLCSNSTLLCSAFSHKMLVMQAGSNLGIPQNPWTAPHPWLPRMDQGCRALGQILLCWS